MSDIELPTFGQWSPTQFDTAGLGSEGQEDWLVCPVSQTRDSGCLERSNFAVVLADLRACDPDATDHRVHRFGHWGPGWFEIIVVRPGTECHSKAQSWASSLASYPVASDDHFSALEWEEANAAWEGASIRERIRLLAGARQSIFAARRSEFPQDDNGSIQQRLLGCWGGEIEPEQQAWIAAEAKEIGMGEPFCACGRRHSDCDGSRRLCHRNKSKT